MGETGRDLIGDHEAVLRQRRLRVAGIDDGQRHVEGSAAGVGEGGVLHGRVDDRVAVQVPLPGEDAAGVRGIGAIGELDQQGRGPALRRGGEGGIETVGGRAGELAHGAVVGADRAGGGVGRVRRCVVDPAPERRRDGRGRADVVGLRECAAGPGRAVEHDVDADVAAEAGVVDERPGERDVDVPRSRDAGAVARAGLDGDRPVQRRDHVEAVVAGERACHRREVDGARRHVDAHVAVGAAGPRGGAGLRAVPQPRDQHRPGDRLAGEVAAVVDELAPHAGRCPVPRERVVLVALRGGVAGRGDQDLGSGEGVAAMTTPRARAERMVGSFGERRTGGAGF